MIGLERDFCEERAGQIVSAVDGQIVDMLVAFGIDKLSLEERGWLLMQVSTKLNELSNQYLNEALDLRK